MNNVVQFQEHRYCTGKFVLYVHVVCAWPNIAQVYSVPYYTSAASTCNRQSLHKCLPHQMCFLYWISLLVLSYAMSSFQFSVHMLLYAWYSVSIIIIISYCYTLSMFCFDFFFG